MFQKYGGKLLAGIPRKGGFACFDMCMTIMPAFFLTFISIVANIAVFVLTILAHQNTMGVILSCAQSIVNAYLVLFVVGAITTVTQWKHIDTTTWKKILYTATFPIFMLTYIPIAFSALFRKVEWKHIDHTVSVSLGDMKKAKRTQSRT